MSHTPIENYLLIGDLHSAALVSAAGAIDWLCWPRFDSASVFAGILDEEHGGTFTVEAPGYTTEASYIPETAVSNITFRGEEGSFAVRDSMLPQPVKRCYNHVLVRTIAAEKGVHTVTLRFVPRPDYGGRTPELTERNGIVRVTHNHGTVFLYPPADAELSVEQEEGIAVVTVTVAEGEAKRVVLEYVEEGEHSCLDEHEDVEAEAIAFWREWVADKAFFDFCRDEMVRSAITLKLMQYYPTGALIAAPTTSLPECIGHERNWDYRYVWMRDATFALYALSVLNCGEEAEHFFEFIDGIVQDENVDDIELMYNIKGESVPEEQELSHLEGYERSTPVRIGNGAGGQFQLDVYGAVIDALYFSWQRRLIDVARHRDTLVKLCTKLSHRWEEKDNGIWEVRAGKQHYTYSKVMAWVGIDRALRMADDAGFARDTIDWLEELEQRIRAWIEEHCRISEKGTYAQYAGAAHQDATNFLFVVLQYLDADAEETQEVVKTTCRELCRDDVFVYRYLSDDGLKGDEGAFVLCTFWMVSALALCGRTEDAARIFHEFERHIADTGLIAEEISPDSGRYLGNFPQAFSHMGYIMAAYYLQRAGGQP